MLVSTRWPTLLAISCVAATSCGNCSLPGRASDAGAWVVDPVWLKADLGQDLARPMGGGTLVVRVPTEPTGLNYLDDRDRGPWTSRMTRGLVYETLLDFEPKTLRLVPMLAEALVLSEDTKTMTLRLRADATFSDGSPLTVEDVLANFDAVMNPENRTSALRNDFAGLAVWQRKGPREIELVWKAGFGFAQRHLAKLPIYSRASLEGDFGSLPMARAPIGTGPYVVSEWKPGDRLVLERNRRSATPSHLQTIVFRFVPEALHAMALAEQGEFDLMTGVSPAAWKAMEAPWPKNLWAQRGYKRVRTFEYNFSYIAWNEALPCFKDEKVRQAFAKVWPAKKVFETVDQELEVPTVCPYYPAGYGCDPNVGWYEYSLTDARDQLAQAGFADHDGDGIVERNGAPLVFTLLVPTETERFNQVALLYQAELRKIGARMDIERVDAMTMLRRVRARDFGAVTREFVQYDSEADLYSMFHSSQDPDSLNVAGYSNPQVDQALDLIRADADPIRRHLVEAAVHATVHEQQPNLIMTSRLGLDLAKKRVHGLAPAPIWYDLRRVWVDPAPDSVTFGAADGGALP